MVHYAKLTVVLSLLVCVACSSQAATPPSSGVSTPRTTSTTGPAAAASPARSPAPVASPAASPAAAPSPAPGASPVAAGSVSGTLVEYGAGTLAVPFNAINQAFQQTQPATTIQPQFGGS